ncbi:hypothetical protein TNCT_74781 [Trichonephila clavata]|uniref:Uncharacterized protein n=1 Tax=Trichonephila clavata TaxID=2740835 RepID=A0A8X6GI24_TRICU|nr:hypothetical protein TNCT_74781 [Trichonephila clavata]
MPPKLLITKFLVENSERAVKGLRRALGKSQPAKIQCRKLAINAPSLDLSSELHVSDKRENMNFHFHIVDPSTHPCLDCLHKRNSVIGNFHLEGGIAVFKV